MIAATSSAKKFRVLITDRFSSDAIAYLRAQADLDVIISANPQPTIDELKDADALIIRSKTPVDFALFSHAPKLKVVVTATSGFDHINFDAAAVSNVTIMHTPDANAQSACELTWALVLSCTRKIHELHRSVKAGDWRGGPRAEQLTGSELGGRTYGIIGLGRIGQRVARVAQAFGMQVVAYDPYQEDIAFTQLGVTRSSLEEALKLSDVLSLHVPATRETHHMLTRAHFEYVSRGLILVNTSRGTAIREDDLCEALDHGWIQAAGLDVFEKEPLSRQSPLLKYNQVILSPHMGATTHEAFAKASGEAAKKALDFLRNKTATDTLPPTAAWYTNPSTLDL